MKEDIILDEADILIIELNKMKKRVLTLCIDCGKELENRGCRLCADCRHIRSNTRSRLMMRERRFINAERALKRYHVRSIDSKKIELKCQVCGFDELVDVHHEGKQVFILCPNHHALVTRGYNSVSEYGIEMVGVDTKKRV